MVISHRYRYLFIEIPHTASTAISQELRNHYDGHLILSKHSNYSEFLQQCSAEERRYFVFAAVRNPLDTVSTEYAKFQANHDSAFTAESERANNGGWVDEDQVARFDFVHNQKRTFTEYLGRFYNKVYNNWFLLGHDRFDAVMRYESIGDSFAEVLAQLEIDPVRTLPVVNRSSGKRTFMSYYDAPAAQQHAAWCFGPFMKKWQYELPSSWENLPVPMTAHMRFHMLDSAVAWASRCMTLSPRSPSMQRIKRLVYGR